MLAEEILEFFKPQPGQWIVDGTLGFGGHSERFLEAGAHVVGIDQDREAIEKATARLGSSPRFHPLHGNAAEMPRLLEEAGFPARVHALLFDLGVSSWQLDRPERGFSFQADGPLDMRMNPESGMTAADLVNSSSEEDLAGILWTYGEERRSRAVARAICRRREQRPFERTSDLAEVVSRCVRGAGKIHPATRTFQALRIAVNRELELLPTILANAVHLLEPGGKLAVISFHSLEDRIVKRFLRHHSTPTIDDPAWPEPKPNPDHHFDLPSKLIQASAEERARNPRARSAKLRLAIRRHS